jgi:uncharacterized protein (TIGR03066 family)
MLAASALVLGLLGGVQAEEKKPDNKTLIVGAWEITRSSPGGTPVGWTMEFTKEGKVKLSGKAEGKEFTFEGTYTVDGDKITMALKVDPSKTEKGDARIKKLTDTELVIDTESDKSYVLKRKK